MRETLLIIKREFRERVASRFFMVGTLLFPLLMIALLLLPRLVGRGGSEWKLAVVSDAPAGVAENFEMLLTAPPKKDDERVNRYRLERVDGTVEAARTRLAERVRSKELDGYVALPADVLEAGTIVFRARKGGSFEVLRELRTAATRAVQSERLKRSGIALSAVAALVAPVKIDEARLTEQGEQRGGALSTFITAYAMAFLIYIMTTLYGVAVMRSVLEEKTNRIAEVLMSTIRASHLMAGKIIGVGSAAVVQVLIWVAITAAVVKLSPSIGGGLTLPEPMLQALNVAPATGALLFLYFVLGFFLYASIFAIVGAAVTSEQEAQSVQFLALIPMIAPMMFLQSILNAPLGGLATTLGIIPFTSPVTMPMRMASTPIPTLEIVVSLALLAAGIIAVSWIAGKVYRVGILSTGKRPSLSELARWVRAACVFGLLSTALAASACNSSNAGNPKVPAGAKSSGGMHAVIETDKGPITIEFFAKEQPKAVENFRLLAEHGYYDGLTFHRIVSGFMIQGGDPAGDGTGGESAWGAPFPDDIDESSPLYRGDYRRGMLAMANSGPNTNGSQFFIMHADYPLPPRYVIFARVTSGMDVVDALAGVQTTMGADGAMSRPVTPVKITKVTIRP